MANRVAAPRGQAAIAAPGSAVRPRAPALAVHHLFEDQPGAGLKIAKQPLQNGEILHRARSRQERLEPRRGGFGIERPVERDAQRLGQRMLKAAAAISAAASLSPSARAVLSRFSASMVLVESTAGFSWA